jgi:hypothetical protein
MRKSPPEGHSPSSHHAAKPQRRALHYQNQQSNYRVELMIENVDGLLRPGMTAYARIEFDRQMVGRILPHKIKRALRPELWLL